MSVLTYRSLEVGTYKLKHCCRHWENRIMTRYTNIQPNEIMGSVSQRWQIRTYDYLHDMNTRAVQRTNSLDEL